MKVFDLQLLTKYWTENHQNILTELKIVKNEKRLKIPMLWIPFGPKNPEIAHKQAIFSHPEHSSEDRRQTRVNLQRKIKAKYNYNEF